MHEGGIEAARKSLTELVKSANTDISERRASYDDAREQLDALKSDAEKLLSDQRSDCQILLERHAQDVDEELTHTKEKLVEFETVYNEKLALLTPVTYWNDKAKSHGWLSRP